MQTIMTAITWLQIFATVFQLITSTSGACSDTNVGIRDELKVIPDAQMTNSSNKGANFLPEFGRLQGTKAWCPNTGDSAPYLQIDLGQLYVICGAEAQGEPEASATTSFTLSFSDDGLTFTDLIPNQQFDGSAANGDVSDFHELSSPETAQYIRFKPTSASICLRVEVYGTPDGVEVTCNANDIQVKIDESLDGSGSGLNVLSLLDSSSSACQSTSDGSSINFDITLGTCGTRVAISRDGVNAFYLNTITSSADDTEFEIICSYIREARFLGDGSGEFNFDMAIFTDEDFETLARGTISLRTPLYFRIQVASLGENTEIHLINCRATTSDDPSDSEAESYTFIEDGCHVGSDSFVTGYDCTTTTNEQTFVLSAFRFTGLTARDLVYFHCQAAVCLTTNSNSICTTQCDACPVDRKRKKRGLGDYSREDLAEENLVLGPYKIIDIEDNDDANGYKKAKDPSGTIADSEGFPVTMVIIVCLGALVAIAIAIAFFVTIRLSRSSRGPAVKDVTIVLTRDNMGFDELDVTALSMKSNEKPIFS